VSGFWPLAGVHAVTGAAGVWSGPHDGAEGYEEEGEADEGACAGLLGGEAGEGAPGHGGGDGEVDPLAQEGVEEDAGDGEEEALEAVEGEGGLGSVEAEDGDEVEQVEEGSGVGESEEER
jgi:hypothetical protein